VATDRNAWALLALLALGCGGGGATDETVPDDPAAALEEDGGTPAAPAAAPAAGPAATPLITPAMLAEVDTVILREVYSYQGGPRDPFVSLIAVGTTGPELPDLELVGILYVESNPARSTAVLRERVSNRRHTVRVGQRLGGRLYVSEISAKDIWFTIDDFGVQRRESLTLRKQEEDFR